LLLVIVLAEVLHFDFWLSAIVRVVCVHPVLLCRLWVIFCCWSLVFVKDAAEHDPEEDEHDDAEAGRRHDDDHSEPILDLLRSRRLECLVALASTRRCFSARDVEGDPAELVDAVGALNAVEADEALRLVERVELVLVGLPSNQQRLDRAICAFAPEELYTLYAAAAVEDPGCVWRLLDWHVIVFAVAGLRWTDRIRHLVGLLVSEALHE